MRKCHAARAYASLLAALLVAGSSRGVDDAPEELRRGDAEPAYVAPPEAAKQATGQVPIYVPPELGSPLESVGAGTRGAGRKATLQPLAPDHLGLTTAEQPTLYWFLAEPTSTRMDLTLRDERSVEPLLEVELPTPATAGIHALRLSDHGVKLGSDRNYQWFVSLVPDPERRSRDFVVGAWIRRNDVAPELRERLAAAPGAGAAFLYAEHGVWYDALAALSAQIDATPGDPTLRAQRAALLEQVGLSEAAAYDRRGGKLP